MKRLGFFLAIFLLLLFCYFGDFSSFHKIQNLNTPYAFLSFIFLSSSVSLVTLRWKKILRFLFDVKIGKRKLWEFFLIGRLSGLFLPKSIGEITARGLTVHFSENVKTANAFQSVFIDLIFDACILLVFITPSLIYVLGYPKLNHSFLLYFILLILLIALLKGNPLRILDYLFSRISRIKLISRFTILSSFFETMLKKMNQRFFSKLIFLSFLRFLSDVCFLYSLSRALNLSIPLETFFWGVSVGQLFIIIGITPGAIGIFEMGWLGVLLYTGINEADSIYFVTMMRLGSTCFIALLLMICHIINFFEKIGQILINTKKVNLG